MNYYKIVRGFGKGDYIPIDETELDKAIFCHLTGTIGAFKNGSITGTHISAVVPDLHAMMGWNEMYELTPEDYRVSRAKKNEAQEFFGLVTSAVKEMVETRRQDMIGKIDYRKLPAAKAVSDGVKMLANKFSA